MAILIPNPCSEDWNGMTPKERGRLCDKCCKVVVDFTQKTTAQIVDFINGNPGTRVCGRFRAEQVSVPAVISPARRSRHFKVFIAALYFVFGAFLFTSCNSGMQTGNGNGGHEYVAGDVAIQDTLHPHNNGDTSKKTDTVKPKPGHTKNQNNIPVKNQAMTMGKVCIRHDDTATNSNSK